MVAFPLVPGDASRSGRDTDPRWPQIDKIYGTAIIGHFRPKSPVVISALTYL